MKNRAFAAAVLVLFLAGFFGCAAPQVAWVHETTVRSGDGSTIYSSLSPRRGEIFFPWYPSTVVDADVYIDGVFVGAMSGGGRITVGVERLGIHTVNARVYLVERGRRADYIGCYSGQVNVTPYYRTSQSIGMWWRVDIYPSPYC